jgi:hypothetical protein
MRTNLPGSTPSTASTIFATCGWMIGQPMADSETNRDALSRQVLLKWH